MSKILTLSGNRKGNNFVEMLSQRISPITKYTNRKFIERQEAKILKSGSEVWNCDIQYSNYGSTYGFKSREIEDLIKSGKDCFIFLPNIEIIKRLKKEYSNVLPIYLETPTYDELRKLGLDVDNEKLKHRFESAERIRNAYEHNSELFDLTISYQSNEIDAMNSILTAVKIAGNSELVSVDNSLVKFVESELTLVNDKLYQHFLKYPDDLYKLPPRKFEELIADIIERFGYQVTLTPTVKDGGYDIQAIKKDGVGEFLYLIECKRYRRDRPVGIELVRQLYTVKQINNANKAGIVTTSYFTKGAKELKRNFAFELDLNDYNNINNWIKTHMKSSR